MEERIVAVRKKFASVSMMVGAVLFCGLLGSTPALLGQAATAPAATEGKSGLEFGLMYVTEDTEYVNASHLWLQGASGELALPLKYHFSLVANVTGDSSSGNNGGPAIGTVAGTAGPRYTWSVPPRYTRHIHSSRLFAEGLIGIVHGFNAVYPTANSTQLSWNTFAMQLGGGYDVDLKKHIALRIIDLHYVRTDFPNGNTNVQNNFRIGAGIIFRLPLP